MEIEVLTWWVVGKGDVSLFALGILERRLACTKARIGIRFNVNGLGVPSKPVRSRRACTSDAVSLAQVLWVGERGKQ